MKLTPAHRVFCSYAYTGEDKAAVHDRMAQVVETFRANGVDAYCNLYDPRRHGLTTPDQFMRLAFEEVKKCDVVFVIKTSERHSEGQIMEAGAALVLDVPMIFAQHESTVDKTYLHTLAEHTFTWSTEEDLRQNICAMYETIPA
jgi:hypothetical protein